MDASATQRFLDTNVQWPSNRFFIPDGGLPAFLQSNLRFKVFLVMMAVFPDAYATDTVKSLTTPQRDELRYRFFAAQIRQNEFRISYEPPAIPSEAAWMFHIIQVLLVVVGFVGEDKPVVNIGEGPEETTDGQIAHAQAGFLLGAALSTFLAKKKSGDEAHLDFPEYTPTTGSQRISRIEAVRPIFAPSPQMTRWPTPSSTTRLSPVGARWNRGTARRHSCGTPRIPSLVRYGAARNSMRSSDSLAAGEAVRAAGFKAMLQAVESVIKKTATRRSMRVLAARMGETKVLRMSSS
ncbi:hypothetical protein B0H13DRAFT_2345339 [Mycena leptocephala]|nr:hypothetical protein B0H13DRAFT_2345339 [Mycena leptocephala]